MVVTAHGGSSRSARRPRPGIVRGLVLAIALMLVCEACGSRRSYDELLAGEAAPVPTTGLAASPDPGAGSTGGEVGTAIDPGAPTTTTAPVGGAGP